MRGFRMIGVIAVLAFAATALVSTASDRGKATHGAKALADHQCLNCHRLDASGEGSAPDLARKPMPQLYSPAGFAALMWNHAPEMWANARNQDLELNELSGHEADDLFVFLWSIRYFDPRGEAIRGKRIITERGCSHCHAFAPTPTGSMVPSFDWATLADPIVLSQQLWNHSGEMLDEMASAGVEWPTLSEGDVADLLTYLQNLKPAREHSRTLTITDPEAGLRVLSNKGCVSCHDKGDSHGFGDLSRRQYRTFSGLAAALWNHTPAMRRQARSQGLEMAELSLDEMRAVTSYLFFSGYFEDCGKVERGGKVFARRGCASCHERGDGTVIHLSPDQARYSAPRLVAAVWRHGPDMLAKLEEANQEWPELSERDMADIIAYLNAANQRSHGPDQPLSAGPNPPNDVDN